MEDNDKGEIRQIVEKHFGLIKTNFSRIAGEKSKEILNNDDLLETCLISVHKLLPLPIRVIIRKKAFLNFCLKNRDMLIK